MNRQLQIMKFGGTSVGDASAIQKVAEIVHAASRESDLVVVVSAMSGVTNQLLEAAKHAAIGDRAAVQAIFSQLRSRHRAAIRELIHSIPQRVRVNLQLEQILEQGERLCESAVALSQLTPATRDAISSLGERLSAPMVAAALQERGVPSGAIEATELIRTDAGHGSAEPHMAATRELCHARLRPLLQNGIVPVVTGFIGATAEGRLTTLGRGGSDYSAAILGAALDANEVTIWTDVDGLMTADPRLVPGASTIAEISYREAAELARCGAKVLHPKTLSPVGESGIPIWIRNTFAPERRGTRITPAGPATEAAIKGLAVMTADTDPSLATVTAVGGNMRNPDVVGRILTVLGSQHLNLISIPAGSFELSFSFVVAKHDLKCALEAIHSDFRLDAVDLRNGNESIPPAAAAWTYAAQDTASAD
jgi:aspartokinase/homoserine dehydrogenase 1